jgi:predicted HAD superfamily Cof-like phosphohydrolase
MTETGKAELFEYLESKMKVKEEYLEVDVDNISQIVQNHSYIGQVHEFHKTFLDLNDVGFNEEILKKRLNLMFEELAEIAEAGGTNVALHFLHLMDMKRINFQEITNAVADKNEGNPMNKVEVLDGFCDLQYVLSGSIDKLGIVQEFDEAFNAVHENNMGKMYDSYTEVMRRAKEYRDKNKELDFQHDIQIIPVGEGELKMGQECKYILKVDGKIIKPKNHKKVNLAKFIKENDNT